ncbi:MAG: metal-dependent hydrolase [Gammaproteobacteria bacterium]|jgi:predicted metal-dependent hydrolase
MTPIPITIKARNPKLSWKLNNERFWFGGCPLKSNWMNALSTTFPHAERFFIESVKHYQDQITDPILAEQVKGFIGQEAAHRKEHDRFNERLIEQGYPVARAEKRIMKLFDWVRNNPDPEVKLALTCALEHFTTILCTEVLKSPIFNEPMNGEYKRLWCWHCLEEIEHKTVAFDVYRAIGGSYRMRLTEIIHASVILWLLLASIMLSYQRHDKRLFNLRDWWVLITWGFIWPGLLIRLVPNYFRYFKRDYHPSHMHDQSLIDTWRDKLGFHGQD